MKRSLLFCLGIYLFCSSVSGQALTQKMLLGKWFLIRHSVDTTLVLDLENPDYTVDYYMKQLKREKSELTRQDSIDVEDNVYRTINGFENYFIEYFENNTYRNTLIKADRNEASDFTESGTYTFIPEESRIIQEEQDGTRHEAKVSIKNKVLKLQIEGKDKKFIMEFRKR